MSTYKKLNSQDVIITPFEVNKGFEFTSSANIFVPELNGVIGRNLTSSFNSSSDPTSGNPVLFNRLVYHNIKQLYYGNYLSGSDGFISDASVVEFNLDGTVNGPEYTTNYNDYIESSIYSLNSASIGSGSYKYFPTEPNSYIGVLSISKKLYGDYIVPKSFRYDNNTTNPFLLLDDGEGNIYALSSSLSGIGEDTIVGNIFYSQGIITITKNPSTAPDINWFSLFNKGITWVTLLPRLYFSSSFTIYETQYKCTIRENEFNYSMNPSLLVSGGLNQIINGKATYKDFVTSSDFSPYVTTIGLYDEDQNLLAIGKLAKPLPTSQTTDTTILVNLDLN
jgi:hypothetical protein